MEKDTYYFSHDYNARMDEKIKHLLSKQGYLGYGIYWAIIEDLYNNTNVLRLNYDSIAYDLHTSPDIIKSVINDFDLFLIDGDIFGSESVERRIAKRVSISTKARESVNKRWENYKKNTIVLPPNNEGNTRKGKERKGKETKGKEKDLNPAAPSSLSPKEIKEIENKEFTECTHFWLKEFHADWHFGGPQGKSLKYILTKLRKIVLPGATVLDAFKTFCLNLPDYYKDKDLQVLNGKYNEILTEIKKQTNGASRKKPASAFSEFGA